MSNFSSYNIYGIFCLFLLTTGCGKNDYGANIRNLNDNRIGIFGHGGMGIRYLYPTNSFESITACLQQNADGTEVDVQLTKDSVLVAFHDADLSGTTNCSGAIHSHLWNDLKACSYDLPVYQDPLLLSLDDLMVNTQNRDQFIFTFDCKLFHPSDGHRLYREQFARAIVRLIEAYEMEGQVFIESQDSSFLRTVQDLRPGYPLFIYPGHFEKGFTVATSLGIYGITISTQDVSEAQIEMAHDNGLRVTIFGVHSKNDNIRGIEKNPDFIQTDRIKHLVRILK